MPQNIRGTIRCGALPCSGPANLPTGWLYVSRPAARLTRLKRRVRPRRRQRMKTGEPVGRRLESDRFEGGRLLSSSLTIATTVSQQYCEVVRPPAESFSRQHPSKIGLTHNVTVDNFRRDKLVLGPPGTMRADQAMPSPPFSDCAGGRGWCCAVPRSCPARGTRVSGLFCAERGRRGVGTRLRVGVPTALHIITSCGTLAKEINAFS